MSAECPKNRTFGIAATVAFLGMAGCQAMLEDFGTPHAKYAPPPMERVEVGATREAVVGALGAPDAIAGVKQTAAGPEETLEWWQYAASFSRDDVAARYRVHLLNGRVTGWETSPR